MEKNERRWLIEEKYGGNEAADTREDEARLARGEPLAYVIGHAPFMGLAIHLGSRPLIPRPETEWWTERLIAYLKKSSPIYERAPESLEPFRVLDLCAGSGAVGLSLLASLPLARVSLGEIDPAHEETIRRNIRENGLDGARADIRIGDLFQPFGEERFNVIAVNPPYIPRMRPLPDSVAGFEPSRALYGGEDGLAVIRRIVPEARAHLFRGGELWMEVDEDHAAQARALVGRFFSRTELIHDQYDRPRLVVGYW